MRNTVFIILVLVLFLPSCNEDNGTHTDTSGTATINNDLAFDPQLQTYVNYGFLFSEAKLVSNVGAPKPDITISNDGTLDNLIIQAKINSKFYKAGEYNNGDLAIQAFDNLTSISVPQWEDWAFSVKPNQVWIFETADEHYAKIRIIETISEIRSQPEPNWKWAECTFEWVYQPDGSLTFPGK
jgi:hypothetical protein